MTDSKTVYRTPGAPTYHTRRDCHEIASSEKVLEKPLAAVEGYLDQCKVCDGHVGPTELDNKTKILGRMSVEEFDRIALDK